MFHKRGEGRCLRNKGQSGGDLREYRKAKCQGEEEALAGSPAAEDQQGQSQRFPKMCEGVGGVVRQNYNPQEQQQNLTCILPEIFFGKIFSNVIVSFSSKQKLQMNVSRTVLEIYIVG